MRSEKLAFIIAIFLVGLGGILIKLSSADKGKIPELPPPEETGPVLVGTGPHLFDEGVLQKLLSRTGRNPWTHIERALRPTSDDIPAPQPSPQPPPLFLPPLSSGGVPSVLSPEKLVSFRVTDTTSETSDQRSQDNKEKPDADK